MVFVVFTNYITIAIIAALVTFFCFCPQLLKMQRTRGKTTITETIIAQIYLRLGTVTQGSSLSGSPLPLHRIHLLSDLLTSFKLVHYHGGLRTIVFGHRRLIVTDGNLGALINTASLLICGIKRGLVMKVKLRRRRTCVYIGKEC